MDQEIGQVQVLDGRVLCGVRNMQSQYIFGNHNKIPLDQVIGSGHSAIQSPQMLHNPNILEHILQLRRNSHNQFPQLNQPGGYH